jgi:hypothetical protein
VWKEEEEGEEEGRKAREAGHCASGTLTTTTTLRRGAPQKAWLCGNSSKRKTVGTWRTSFAAILE